MNQQGNLGNGMLDGFNSEMFKIGNALPQWALPSPKLSSTGDHCRSLGLEIHSCENHGHCFHWVECVISLRCEKEVVKGGLPRASEQVE